MYRYCAVSLAAIGLFLGATGCSSYGYMETASIILDPGPAHASGYIQIDPQEANHYGKVRVTTLAGQTVSMKDPRIEDGSIKSREIGAIPLSQVTKVEALASTHDGDYAAENAAAALGVVAGLALFLLLTEEMRRY